MAKPRRFSQPQVEHGPVEDSSPRRGSGGVKNNQRGLAAFVRRAVAPTAVVGLLALTTTLTFVPTGIDRAEVAEAAPQADVAMGISRNYVREAPALGPALDTTIAAAVNPPVVPVTIAPPTPTPSPTPSAEPTPEPEPEPTPEPTPTATASAKPSETKTEKPAQRAATPDWSKLGDEAGTRYVTSPVHVRTGPGRGYDSVTTLAEGAAVKITDKSSDGWQQVNRKGKAGWIKASYLDKDKPAAPETQAASASSSKSSKSAKSASSSKPSKSASSSKSSTSSSSDSSSSSSVSTSSCSKVSRIEGGLTARATDVARALCNKFPGISSFGGYRAGGGSYHSSGRAIDAMISGEAGWEVARWARSNASALGITEVIYAQKIWTTQRSGEGWRSMSDRGSVSANHYDHVHISVR